VEICSACHPYFTGKQKLVDTAGRVERFRQRYGGGAREVSRRAGDAPALSLGRDPRRARGSAHGRAIREVERRYEEISSLLADPEVIADPKRLRDVSREHSQLSEVVAAIERVRRDRRQLEGAERARWPRAGWTRS
jgi:hypothetical protein